MTLSSHLTQLFPKKPAFTAASLGDLRGKVYLITGGNTGLGKELARILYGANATVYIACRSAVKAQTALSDIKAACPSSRGALCALSIDLADLATIKPAVSRFLAAESRLDVLFNNAGIMAPKPPYEKTAQGHEMHLGVNNLGHFLLTKLLTPTLVATAKTSPRDTVRVAWVASAATELRGVEGTGVDLDNLDGHKEMPGLLSYALSKAGNWLQGAEYRRRFGPEGVVSVTLNPGNLWSDLYRDGAMLFRCFAWCVTYPVINGAYTELFAGLSPDVTAEAMGESKWVIPFGRIFDIRPDLVLATKPPSEGGTGASQKFWEWSEEQVKSYL